MYVGESVLHTRAHTYAFSHTLCALLVQLTPTRSAAIAALRTLLGEQTCLCLFITNARTTMPFARLHSQMVCTQSEPAKIPQHMFVQILVQVGGDRKRRTSRTTLRTPTPLVIRHCFLVYCVRTWKISFPPYLQMSETQISNELLHGNLCGSQHFRFEHCTTLQSIERIRDLSRPARTIKRSKMQICLQQKFLMVTAHFTSLLFCVLPTCQWMQGHTIFRLEKKNDKKKSVQNQGASFYSCFKQTNAFQQSYSLFLICVFWHPERMCMSQSRLGGRSLHVISSIIIHGNRFYSERAWTFLNS